MDLRKHPSSWHEMFERTLTAAGFVVNEADKCVYYHHGGGEGVILCLYVDDILSVYKSRGLSIHLLLVHGQS